MANPYQASPAPSVPEEKSVSGIKHWSRSQWIMAIVSVIAAILLAMISIVLIMQAMRLNSESAALPARLRSDYAASAGSSWVGGIAAMIGSLLNLGGLLFIRKNKIVLPLAMIAISIVGMIAISILFKPS